MAPRQPVGQVLETFGSYRLVWLLGQGGMAELYLALRSGIEGFEKVVALKRILPSFTQDPSFIDMFLDEARLAAKLDHPHIVRIYDLGEIDHQFFMAMEYLPGEDLREIHRRARELHQPVPVDIACSIMHDTALALDFAHKLTDAEGVPMSLVHRDVSPSNILVTYHGSVKLVDFGIAKARNSSVHTQTGSFKGKLPYSSPEQLRSERVDHRADIFGMGIVLWELLVGQRLFQRDSYAAVLYAVKGDEIPAPSSIRRDLPPELDGVVLRALARDRNERYQSALDVQVALEEVLRHFSGYRTSRQIGQWLTALFGEDRANAKTAMAQGKHLEHAIPGVMQPLRPAFQPRSLWVRAPGDPAVSPSAQTARLRPSSDGSGGARRASFHPSTSHGGEFPLPDAEAPLALGGWAATPPPGTVLSSEPFLEEKDVPERTPRRVWLGVSVGALMGLALASAASLVAFAWVTATSGLEGAEISPQTASLTASVTLESVPEGAAIFLDGEPIGQKTPATLDGFSSARRLAVRLVKDGYVAKGEEVDLRPGERTVKRVVLERDEGAAGARSEGSSGR